MRIPRIAVAVATLVILISACSLVMGQPKVGTSGTAPKGSAPKPTGKAPVRTVYIMKESVTATTGSLSVAAEPDANLLVEPLNIPGAVGQKAVVPAGERIFIFNGLKPGQYRVAGTLAGYAPIEKRITIKKAEGSKLTLDFEPILFPATIKTNILSGELKYGEEGQPLERVASIENGKVQLSLPAGKYAFEITPGEGQSGFEVFRDTFSLTKAQTFEFKLKSIESTETLSPTWTRAELQGWEIPSGWQADSKRNLHVKGSGVALPREERNRHYKNFRLESNVKMLNGVAVSFALRARDAQNYYLLQLTGANADEPYVVRLFVVKNGVQQRLRAIPVSRSSAAAMTSGQFFNVSVKVINFEITVDIVDSQTGAPYTLGVLTDPDHNFAVGAVGIAASDNEENMIERFVICPTAQCLQERS